MKGAREDMHHACMGALLSYLNSQYRVYPALQKEGNPQFPLFQIPQAAALGLMPPSHPPSSPLPLSASPPHTAPPPPFPAGVLRLWRGAETASTPAPGLPRQTSSVSGAETASTRPLPDLHPPVALVPSVEP